MYQNVTTRSYRKGLFWLAKLFLLVPGTICVGATTNQQISPILVTATANHNKNQLPREFFAEEGEESPLTRRAIYCEEFTVTMETSYGYGWNGNILYIGEFTLTLDDYRSDSYAVTTICLPPDVYTPYCCEGSYDSEVSWSVGGLSGGADDTCSGTAGSFTGKEQAEDSGLASCDLCPAGKTSSSRASECVACDAGTSSEEGSAACSDCDAGKFSFGSSQNCSVCAAGKASGSRASECVACEAGKFADSDGSDVCEE